MRRAIACIVLLAGIPLLGVLGVQGASAEDNVQKQYLYQWTDEQGSAHITDSLEKVPVKYRTKAKRLEQGLSGGGGTTDTQVPVREEPRGFSLSEDAATLDDEERKMEWQQRMYDARQRMAEAQERLERSAAQLKVLQEKTGYGLYGYTAEAAAEAARLEEETSRAQIDLDRARDEVENVIPEQARKAGIPPGWLREVQ